MQSQNFTVVKSQSPTNGKEEEMNTDAESMEEELEFSWDEFIEERGGSSAPHTNFKHVEISLQSSFQPGMKLEVSNKSSPDSYWVATVITTCGQLLLLRYCGYGEDRRADFWCDVMTGDLHPVGWCAQHDKTLMPPEAIKEKHSDWTEFLVQDLTGSRTAPANLLEGPLRGKNTVDLITVGSVLELQDQCEPLQFWPARVVQNTGGRLCLRYCGLEEQHREVWLFYLDLRLRPLGWAQDNGLSLQPPTELRSLHSSSEWEQALEEAQREGQKNPLPLEVFKDHVDLPKHSFKVGMKLEMVPWRDRLQICPVSVTKVYNEFFFQLTVDDLSADAQPCSLVCHQLSPSILPVQWSLKHGLSLELPPGFEGQDFDWADYLKKSWAEAAPDTCFSDTWMSRGFSKDMWLEAVNPAEETQVCVAQVTQVTGRLLWLRLEGVSKSQSECIVDCESMEIFPVGWCEANGYHLTPPLKPISQKQKKIAVVQPEKQLIQSQPEEVPPVHLCPPVSMDTGSVNGRYSCSKIFVNHRCFSGPYLNKGRIAELPQAVGPGKCALVLKELLTMLINAAYKPGRVLKELQDLQDHSWDCQQETLKAKYKGKTYRSSIQIVRIADQIPEFCRKVCLKLQCCPNLFSPTQVSEKCPENCALQTKTKFTYYYGKKRKLSRVGGGEDAEGDQAKPARRRKKRKSIFVQKKRRSFTVDYTAAGYTQDSDEGEEDEDFFFQSGSECTSSEPRDDSSVAEVVSCRPRRAATLRRRVGGEREGDTRLRRSTRSLSIYSHHKTPTQQDVQVEADESQLVLDRNPLEWTVDEVVQFISSTDCSSLANIFQEQDIDGQALLLLTLPTVQECMDLKLGPAIKLCHHIERVKVAFYRQYAN